METWDVTYYSVRKFVGYATKHWDSWVCSKMGDTQNKVAI
jgi:hypothetical protein